MFEILLRGMLKEWQVAKKYDNKFASKFSEISPVVLQLFYNRGFKNQDEVDKFLSPDYARDQHDPYLFSDMDKAVKRIYQALEKGERIVVYGDYDADGVSSTALMYLSLKHLGAKHLSVYIPNRLKEGYGMNKEAIEGLAKDKADLIITVDCGIGAKEEVELARQRGIDVIVTDHHLSPDELPEAYAVICPTVKGEKYPWQHLTGVGVAYKLAQALFRHKSKSHEAAEKWLLDLVAIGTVADCMPLMGENRTLVKWGLLVLNKTRKLGLSELIGSIGVNKELTSQNISFQIAPRLNAAGRMDHANTAYELLITEDEAEAIAIVNDLNQKNQERQRVTEEMMKISLEQIGEPKEDEKVLFSGYDTWSPGLVGLAAGKLADRFHRPVIVFGKMGDKYVASGRSIAEFDITGALSECSEYLAEFGGHEGACGLTVIGQENYDKFKKKIIRVANQKLKGVKLVPSLEIEAGIELNQANWELLDELEKFAPFGEGNSEPLFLSQNLKLVEFTTMGSTGQHLRLILEDKEDRISHKFVGFGLSEKWAEKLKVGDKLDVVYELSVNEWNGSRELQFKVVDIRHSQDTRNKIQ